MSASGGFNMTSASVRCAAKPDTLFTMPACIRIWKMLMRRLPLRPRAKNFQNGGPSPGAPCAEKL